MSSSQDILQFWFGDLNDQSTLDKNPIVKRWFIKDKKFDEDIRQRFEEDLIKADQWWYREWEQTPKGALAVIILFDQFSRNIYRGTPKAFEFDLKALTLSLEALHREDDLKLSLIERTFIYMPLEHDEDLASQKLCVKSFQKLVEDSKFRSPQNTDYFKYNLEYAQKHFEIIKRFGRFPHRNAILGRPSTKEESAFLKTPGSSF